MLRNLLIIAVLLGPIQAPHSYPNPPRNPYQEYNLYLPLVFNSYSISLPLVEVVRLGVFDYIGYPGNICLFGYTTGNSPTAVYSVTVAIEVIESGYCPPEEPSCPPPTTVTHYVEPMLRATLLDQKNPFSYCLMYGKNSYQYGDVVLASYSHNPLSGKVSYPLTVTSWTKQGTSWETTVTGIVRNDSGHRLVEIRVVGIAGLCSAKEADLGVTILDPGEETNFIFNQFYCPPQPVPVYSMSTMVEISAQGVAEP